MFSLSVVCTLNTQLKLLLFKRCTVLRQTVNGNFNLTPTVALHAVTGGGGGGAYEPGVWCFHLIAFTQHNNNVTSLYLWKFHSLLFSY